jgi:hypothetical protein
MNIIVFSKFVSNECNGRQIAYKSFIAGFENRDLLSIDDIIKSGKSESANKAFTILSFKIGFGGDGLTNGMPAEMFIEKNLLTQCHKKILEKLRTRAILYFDCIEAKNKIGEIYFLKSFSVRLLKK